jgi:hypothetical protein
MTDTTPPAPEGSPVPIQIPTSRELFEFFEKFLVRWANVACEYIPWAPETLLPMGLEEGILFSEPTSGLLVIRASENFRRYLLDEFDRKQKGAASPKNEIFLEMTVLFWHLFVNQYFHMDSRRMTPALLRTSIPADWPDREPQAAALIMVKGNPMELRLWTGLQPSDITRFRRAKG